MRIYDKNLVISLCEPDFLIEKYNQSQLPTKVINIQFDIFGIVLKLSEEDKKKLNQLTDHSRLYINAHGTNGDPFLIHNKKGDFLTYLELANIITLAKAGSGNALSGLKITLNICYAAKKYTIPSLNHINKSFADVLQEYLISQGMDNIDIVAYTEIVWARRHPHPKENKIYKLNGKRPEITNFIQQIDDMRKTSRASSSSSISQTRISDNAIEREILIFKTSQRLIPNQKILFFQDNKHSNSIDYYQEKTWENNITHCLNEVGLPTIATVFNQFRTYRDKLCFFRHLQNLASPENREENHHLTPTQTTPSFNRA